MPERQNQRDLDKRQSRPSVIVNLDPGQYGRRLAELSRELGWQILDIRFRGGLLPRNEVVAGAIVQQMHGYRSDQLVGDLLELGIPMVRIGGASLPDDQSVPLVMEDLHSAGQLAAEHFAERGFHHVGYVGRQPWGQFKIMYDGLKERSAELGCQCHMLRIKDLEDKPTYADRYRRHRRLVAQWVDTVPRPLGLLGFADAWTTSLCNMCQDSGIVVPEEVALLGHGDNLAESEFVRPTLSSIIVDYNREAEVAVDILRRLMDGKTVKQTRVMIPPKGVVSRESTDVLAVEDPRLARALRVIWDYYHLNLSVEDVAKASDLSRRSLERLFHQHLGRGINEVIGRKRLKEFHKLLLTSDHSVADLATRAGFRSQTYLHQRFRDAYGTSPHKYRLKERAKIEQ